MRAADISLAAVFPDLDEWGHNASRSALASGRQLEPHRRNIRTGDDEVALAIAHDEGGHERCVKIAQGHTQQPFMAADLGGAK